MSKELADQLRKAIHDSGQSANEIAKACGVPQTTVSRFLRGGEISIGKASKIAVYLGMSLKKT